MTDRVDSGARVPRIEFSASPPEVVCSASQRQEHDLHHWVDGTMGVVRSGDDTLVVGPNGPRLVVHRFGRTGLGELFDAGLAGTALVIGGLPADVDHASGGPLLRDPDSGRLVLVYHGEHFADGDPRHFESFIGLAVSDDDGTSFRDLGAVVRPAASEVESRHRLVEVGPGAAVVVGDHLHLYFTERSDVAQWLRVGVARCRLDEVFAAAGRGAVPEFRKFHRDEFVEPALGGTASDLFPHDGPYVGWIDVAHLAGPDVLVLVCSTVVRTDGRVIGWERRASCSRDGVRWSPSTSIDPAPVPAELLYLTIDSGGREQRRVDGGEFDLYRLAAAAPYRWHDARVERQRVRWTVVEEDGAVRP